MFDFLGIGKTLKNFAGELAGVRAQIEVLTREIEDIQFAPAGIDDVTRALENWARSNSTKYREYLQSVLTGLVNRPRILADGTEVWRHLSSMEIMPEPSMHRPLSRDIQLCGLLGPDAFVALMKTQMQSMDWPAPGLPIAAREEAVKALEQKIIKLRASEAALIRSAETAGLTVS